MRKHVVLASVLVVGIATVACEVQVGSKPAQPATPTPAKPAAVTPAPAPTPTPNPNRLPRRSIGRIKTVPSATPATPGTPPAPSGTTPVTPPPGPGNAILVGTNVFGTGTPDPNGWSGEIYMIPAGTAKMPAFTSMTPAGALFASSLNVTSKPMTGGFPGIDATRNENFAIRWDAALVVDNEGDYTFRIVSDDGAQISIDGTVILDNDGLATNNTPKEKSGPVHLVKATHDITVDYFQATGNVALQLFCTKAGGNEQLCPTHL